MSITLFSQADMASLTEGIKNMHFKDDPIIHTHAKNYLVI